MMKYVFGLIGLALLAGQPLQAGEAPCGCEKAACNSCNSCNSCNNGCKGCNGCGRQCCPNCGCCLVPECHVCCTSKPVTNYTRDCICKTICVPGVTPICGGCDECKDCNSCGGRCLVRNVKQLVKYPCVKEVPVRTCTVEWVCPKCGGDYQPAPAAAPAAPSPAMPSALPPAPKTTEMAPLPANVSYATAR